MSILNALLAMLLLVSGFKNYVKFQYVMWYATLLSFGLMLYLFFTASPESFAQKLDAFVTASGGAPNFYQTAIDAAKAANIDLNPPSVYADAVGRFDRLDLAAMGDAIAPSRTARSMVPARSEPAIIILRR